jgi:hypothetical protein
LRRAGGPVVGPSVDNAAFRRESTVSGMVTRRGAIGITGPNPTFAQGVPFANIPHASGLRPRSPAS